MEPKPDRVTGAGGGATAAGSYYAPRMPSWRSNTSSTNGSSVVLPRRSTGGSGGRGWSGSKATSPKAGAAAVASKTGVSSREGSSVSMSAPAASRLGSTRSVRSARAVLDEASIANGTYMTAPHESQRIVLHGAVVRDVCTEVDSQLFEQSAVSEVLSGGSEPRGVIKSRHSIPSLQFSSFNVSWVVDVFSLAHNAARRELVDLYDMLESMEKRKRELLIPQDVTLLFQWLRAFRVFLFAYFECEDKVIFPWIESRCILMTELSRAMRLGAVSRLRALLNAVFLLERDLEKAQPPVQNTAARRASSGRLGLKMQAQKKGDIIRTDSVPTLLRIVVDKFVMELNAYFRMTSSKLHPLIASAFVLKDKRELDREVARFWWATPNRRSNICILTFWINEIYGQKAYLSWKYDHLGVQRSVRVSLYEKTHERHLGIPRRYRRKAKEFSAKQQEEQMVRFRSKNELKIIPARSTKSMRSGNSDDDDHTDLSWARSGMNTPRYAGGNMPVVLAASRMNSLDGEGADARGAAYDEEVMLGDAVDVVEEEYVGGQQVEDLMNLMRQKQRHGSSALPLTALSSSHGLADRTAASSPDSAHLSARPPLPKSRSMVSWATPHGA